MQYVSNDGKVFENEKDCLAYEKKTTNESDKLLTEIVSMVEKLNKEQDILNDLINEFMNKYPKRHDDLFKILEDYFEEEDDDDDDECDCEDEECGEAKIAYYARILVNVFNDLVQAVEETDGGCF